MATLPSSTPVIFPKLVYVDATSTLLGTMANWMLFGILWVQVYLYYVAFSKDTRLLKFIVFVQLLLETIQTVTFTHDTVQGLAISFIDPNVFNQVDTAWCYVPLMTGLIAFITQGMYCYRVLVLTKSKSAVTLIGMLSLGQLVAAIYLTIQTKHAILLSSLLSDSRSLTTIGIWGTCSLACDLLIAAIVSHYLKKQDTSFQNTKSVITRLIRLSTEAGCATALWAGALLVLVYLPRHPPYYEIAASVAAKIHSNTMMAVLNSRIKTVSNSPAFSAPLWNESVKPNALIYTTGRAQGIVFHRECEMAFNSSRLPGSSTAP
ncbi:hypothetical protein HYPSUDRAFT_41576 [Hypholoma sublateritium FD-334 SS-4]|uniref:DUF6534 domain-containing protein n=1 Tax=Hypholoma sublateritium (strain FD-334 SS-4) TaxID=945553 RepID=A0A0D2NZ58_HYPSF|nr:hypothetical protein HYPSUDRAFT_41576 [Hypholoma sublateritium FD-334 SS-4]